MKTFMGHGAGSLPWGAFVTCVLGVAFTPTAVLASEVCDPCCPPKAAAAKPQPTKENAMVKYLKTKRQLIPVACNLSDAAKQVRRKELTQKLFGGVQAVEELPDGYQFEFPGREEWTGRLMEFVSTERRCCPFFKFELTLDPGEGPVYLRLRGSDEVKRFIQAKMLPKKESFAR